MALSQPTMATRELVWALLMTWDLVLFVAFIAALRDFWRHRLVFPFTVRILPLNYIFLGASLWQVFNVGAKLAYINHDCADRICGLYDIYALGYCYGITLVAWAGVGRGVVLVFRHKLVAVTKTMQTIQMNSELTAVQKKTQINALSDTFWMKKRHWLQDKVIYRATLYFYLPVVVMQTIVYAIFQGTNENKSFELFFITHVFLISLMAIVPYLVWELAKANADAFGIRTELAVVTGSGAVILTTYTWFSNGYSAWTARTYITEGCSLALHTMILGLSLLKSLYMIDRTQTETGTKELGYRGKQGSKHAGVAGKSTFSVSSRISQVASVAFHTTDCLDVSFEGICSSEEGYNAFLAFMETEFATENLLFWRQAVTLRTLILSKIPKKYNGRNSGIVESETDMALDEGGHGNGRRMRMASKTNTKSQSSLNHPRNQQQQRVPLPRHSGQRLTPAMDSVRIVASPLPGSMSAVSRVSVTADNNTHPASVPLRVSERLSLSRILQEEDSDSDLSEGKFGGDRTMLHEYEEEELIPFLERARYIFNTYLARNAMLEVNVPSMVQKNTQKLMDVLEDLQKSFPDAEKLYVQSPLKDIEANVELLLHLKNIFLLSAKEILQLIKFDSFPRFTRTKKFEALKTLVVERHSV